VQQARRDAGLDVSDRIALVLDGDEEVRTALHRHHELVAREVLAATVDVGGTLDGTTTTAAVGDGQQVALALRRA
jgi:isoleucyl-tRNA synthetase